jgi:hypothetical protein
MTDGRRNAKLENYWSIQNACATNVQMIICTSAKGQVFRTVNDVETKNMRRVYTENNNNNNNNIQRETTVNRRLGGPQNRSGRFGEQLKSLTLPGVEA